MGFWEWHSKMWNSKELILQFQHLWDEDGNVDSRIEILGSKFWYRKQITPPRELKKLEQKMELLDYED